MVERFICKVSFQSSALEVNTTLFDLIFHVIVLRPCPSGVSRQKFGRGLTVAPHETLSRAKSSKQTKTAAAVLALVKTNSNCHVQWRPTVWNTFRQVRERLVAADTGSY